MHRCLHLLLLLATSAQVYSFASVHVKLSIDAADSPPSPIRLCVSKTGRNCSSSHVMTIKERQWKEDNGKQEAREFEVIEQPWHHPTKMYFIWGTPKTRAVIDISDLNPRGKSSMTTKIADIISLTIDIRCHHGFYGATCTKGCDTMKGHHSCDSDGMWVCEGGRTGKYCEYDSEGNETSFPLVEEKKEKDHNMEIVGLLVVAGCAIGITLYSFKRRQARAEHHFEAAPMVLIQ